MLCTCQLHLVIVIVGLFGCQLYSVSSGQRKQPLGFREGKHTLRFALRLSPDDKGQPVSIISNPVKIEILPEEKPDEEVEGEGVI